MKNSSVMVGQVKRLAGFWQAGRLKSVHFLPKGSATARTANEKNSIDTECPHHVLVDNLRWHCRGQGFDPPRLHQ